MPDLCFDAPPGTIYVFTDKTLCANNSPVKLYEMGVNSSGNLTDWLKEEEGGRRMEYPPRQQWGAVFITVGKPVPPGNRPGQDLSRCQTLQEDLRADTQNAILKVGMKDAGQPDDGSEPKIDTTTSANWETKTFPLSSFGSLSLNQVYTPIEFVFGADSPMTIHFRNIRFICSK